MATEEDLELAEEEKKGSKKWLIIGAAVVLLGGGAAAFFLMGGDDASAEQAAQEPAVASEAAPAPALTKGAPIYVEVPEAILAQIPDGRKTRMVQVRVTLVVRSPEAEDMVKKHMPLIRNNLLEFLTRTGAKALRTPEGREAMKQGALEEVQKLMKEQSGQTLVDRVLFPSFVMQ